MRLGQRQDAENRRPRQQKRSSQLVMVPCHCARPLQARPAVHAVAPSSPPPAKARRRRARAAMRHAARRPRAAALTGRGAWAFARRQRPQPQQTAASPARLPEHGEMLAPPIKRCGHRCSLLLARNGSALAGWTEYSAALEGDSRCNTIGRPGPPSPRPRPDADRAGGVSHPDEEQGRSNTHQHKRRQTPMSNPVPQLASLSDGESLDGLVDDRTGARRNRPT